MHRPQDNINNADKQRFQQASEGHSNGQRSLRRHRSEVGGKLGGKWNVRTPELRQPEHTPTCACSCKCACTCMMWLHADTTSTLVHFLYDMHTVCSSACPLGYAPRNLQFTSCMCLVRTVKMLVWVQTCWCRGSRTQYGCACSHPLHCSGVRRV